MRQYLRQGFLVIAVLFLLGQSAFAALPPQYLNIRDLDVMVKFIKEHTGSNIAYSLKSIDCERNIIHFGNGCKALFDRGGPVASRENPPPPGPEAVLRFRRFDCDEHEGENCLVK